MRVFDKNAVICNRARAHHAMVMQQYLKNKEQQQQQHQQQLLEATEAAAQFLVALYVQIGFMRVDQCGYDIGFMQRPKA